MFRFWQANACKRIVEGKVFPWATIAVRQDKKFKKKTQKKIKSYKNLKKDYENVNIGVYIILLKRRKSGDYKNRKKC